MDIGVARGEIQIETGQAISSLNQFGSALQQASQMGMGAMQAQGIQIQQQGLAYQQLGRVAIGAGTAMAAPFVGAFKAAMDFESQMAGVNAVMDLQGDEFENLSKLASQLGQDTIFSGTEAARAIETLGKAGISYEDIVGGAAQASTDLAAAAETDVATAADAIAAGIQAFGLAGDEANVVADVIASAANISLASAEDLAMGLGNVGSTAASANMDIYDTGAALAILTDRGQSGTDAATTLRTAIQHLVAPIGQTVKAIDELGIQTTDSAGQFVGLEDIARQLIQTWDDLGTSEADQLKHMKMLAGQDGMRALIGMVDAVRKEYSETEKGIDDYNAAMREQGSAQAYAEARMDSTAGAIERLMGSLAVLGERVGAPMLTAVRPVVEVLDRIVDALANLPAPVLAAVAALGSLTAAFTLLGGVGLFAAGHLVEAIGRLTSVGVDVAAIALRIRGLVPVILAVTAALTALAIAWENDFLGMRTTVEDFFGGIRDAFNEGMEIAGKLNMDGIAQQIYAVSEAIRSLGAEEFAQKIRIISGAVQDFFDIRDKLQDAIKEETPTWTSPQESDPILGDPKMGEDAINFLENLQTSLAAGAISLDKWVGKGNKVSKFLRDASKGAGDFAKRWDQIQDMGFSGITGATLALSDFFAAIGAEGLSNVFGEIGSAIQDFEFNMKNNIARGVNPFSAAIASLGYSIEGLTGIPISDTFTKWAQAIENGADTVQNLMNAGVSPLSAALGGLQIALDDLGFEWLADRAGDASLAAQKFTESYDAAREQGLNPFHSAAIATLDAIDMLAGGTSGVTQAIRGVIGGVQGFIDSVGPSLEKFGETWNSVYEQYRFIGEGELQAGIRATAAAIGELLGIDLSGVASGLVVFTETLGGIKDALLAGDWSGVAEGVQSAIDQIVGAVQSINIPQVVVNIGGFVLGEISQTVGEFIDGLFGGGEINAGSASADPRFGGSVGGATGAGHWVRGVVINIADWAEGTIDSISDAIKPWIEEKKAGAVAAAETTLDAIKVNVSGWIVGLVEGARDIVTAVKEWALGGSYDSLGGPGERGEAGTNTGALEIAFGAVKAVVSGWLVEAAAGIGSLVDKVREWALGKSPNSTGGPGERGEAGTGDGALEVAFGAVTATVSGWIVQLADGAKDLLTAVKEWALGGPGGSNSVLGPGGELTGPGGRGNTGSSGALVELGEIAASIGGWIISSVQTVATAVGEWIKNDSGIADAEVPINRVTAQIGGWIITSLESIGDAVTRFVQGGEINAGSASADPRFGGTVGGIPIGEIVVTIEKIVPQLIAGADSVVKTIYDWIYDQMSKLTGDAAAAEEAYQRGFEIGETVGTIVFSAIAEGLTSGSATNEEAAYNVGYAAGSQSYSLVRSILTGLFDGLERAFAEQILGYEVDLSALLPGGEGADQFIKIRNPDAPVYALIDGLAHGTDQQKALFQQGIQAYFNSLSADGVTVDSPYVNVDGTFNLDTLNADWHLITPDNPTVDGDFPILMNVETGKVIGFDGIELEPGMEVRSAIMAGQLTVTPSGLVVFPDTGMPVMMEKGPDGEIRVAAPVVVDPTETTVEGAEGGAGNPIQAGEPIYIQGETFYNAAGQEIQLSPETATMLREAVQLDEVIHVEPDGAVMLLNPDTGQFDIPVTPEMFDGPISEQLQGMTLPASEQALKNPILAAMAGAMNLASTGGVGGTGTGVPALIQGLDNLLAGGVGTGGAESLPNFLQAAQGLVQQGMSALGRLIGGGGETAAPTAEGTAIGDQVMQSLAQQIAGADTSQVQQILKQKIGEALVAGMSSTSGGQASGGDAASGIGTSVATSLASAISSADFASVGSAISTKISSALATGMTTAGGQAGGAGAAGGAGGGIGASVANSLVSAVEGADFSAIGQTISTKLGEALQNVKGEGLGAALQGVFDTLAADAANMAASLQPVGAAIVEGIASGTGAATGVLQSAVDAVMQASVASASATASGSTPPIGTAFVTGAASGVGPATGTFQSAVDAMIQAAVASGSATATSSAVAVGAGFATGSGTGIGENTGILQEAVGAMISAAVDSGVGVAASLAPAIGAAIAAGAAEGVRANAAQVAAEAAAMVTAAVEAANAAAAISSPSRVFMEIGGYMAEGTALGIREKTRNVADAARSMVQKAIKETEGLRNINKEVGQNAGDVNKELKSIEEIAGILENAPGWNDFGSILRSSSAGIKDSVGAIREDVKDLVRSVKEQLKDMVHQFREAGKQSGSAIGEGIASGAGGAGSGIGGSIEKTLNSEMANINLDQLVIGRDMFKTAKQGIGELKGVGGELNNILQIAEILENAPGWNDFGAMLREAAGNIQGDVGGARDKFRDIAKEMNQISRDQAKAMKEIMKELAATIGDLASKVGENAGSGMSSGMSKGQESAETAGSDMAYGSVGAIESTIENLKGNLSNVGMGAGQALGGGMQKTASEMTEIGNEVGTALGDGATQGLQDSIEGGTEIAETAGDSLGSSFNSGVAGTIPDAMQLGSQISNSVLEALRASAIGDTEAVRMIGDAFGTAFGQGISSATPEAVQAGKNLTDATETGMIAGSPSAEGTATGVGKDIGSSLGSGIEAACKPVNSAARDITSECAGGGIESAEPGSVKSAERAGENIGDALGDGMSDSSRGVEREGKALGLDAVTSVQDAIDSNANKMKSSVTTMVNKAKVDPSADAKTVGTNFVSGMVTGLDLKKGDLYNKVIQIVNEAINKANTTAQNASPSKRMIEWGENVGDGMIVGLAQKADPLVDTMASMVESVVDAAQIGEVSVGTFTMDAVGQNMKWAASQVNSLLDRGTSERMRALEAYTSNKSGKQSASKASSSPTIQVGDIILKEGDPLYDQAKSFFGSVAAQHIPYYGSSRRS